jgi:tRNA:m4X modification enzyme
MEGVSRETRQRVGVLCKRLIDYGRLRWVQQQGLEAEIVCYADSKTTGENRLLLARV